MKTRWVLPTILWILLSAQKCESPQETQEPHTILLSVADSTLNVPEETASDTVPHSDTLPALPFSYALLRDGDVLIEHPGFMLVYSEAHEQAFWVGYELTSEKARGEFSRTDRFFEDPKIETGSATTSDYAGSGFDRGHLAPAADMAWSEESMHASFYFSNMSPQLPGFNRGVWKRLEGQVREWAEIHEDVYIVTGPVLSTSDLPVIGQNEVSVPRYYYKVIMDCSDPEWMGIGFVLENTSSSLPLEHFAVSIDSVQRLTGLDFFQFVPDSLEQILEAENCFSCW